MKKNAAIHTFGCKLNQTESMGIRYQLENAGYNIVPHNQNADLFIINTCTVTAKSDAHARQFIRKTKKNNPNALVIVTGCYPQTNPDIIASIQGVDIVLGIKEKNNILKFIDDYNINKKPLVRVSDISKEKDFADFEYSTFGSYTRAFIKIQDGCDSTCSYCIVRIARGPNRSANPDLIIKKIQNLVEKDYKEVVLTGVHLGTYGNDLNGNWNLSRLLEKICAVEDLKQVRLSSIEPTEFNEELIDIISSENKIAKHFHIPLQSGSDKILDLMERPYSPEIYGDLIEKIKSRILDAAIGADVLVGFPGEFDQDFQKTMNLIKRIPISYLHVFSYSKRPGTKASIMDNQVHPETKKERSKKLRSLGKEHWKYFCSQFIGNEQEFLILTSRDLNSGLLRGISHNYLRILVDGSNRWMNQYTKIIIESFKNGILYGSLAGD